MQNWQKLPVPISTTGHSPSQLGGTRHPNIQKPFHCYTIWSWWIISNAIMRFVTTTNSGDIKSAMTSQCGPDYLGIWICPWKIWLQQNSISSSQMSTKAMYLGRALSWWMVFMNITKTLSLSCCFHQENMKQMSLWYGCFQASIPNSTRSNGRRQAHTGVTTSQSSCDKIKHSQDKTALKELKKNLHTSGRRHQLSRFDLMKPPNLQGWRLHTLLRETAAA